MTIPRDELIKRAGLIHRTLRSAGHAVESALSDTGKAFKKAGNGLVDIGFKANGGQVKTLESRYIGRTREVKGMPFSKKRGNIKVHNQMVKARQSEFKMANKQKKMEMIREKGGDAAVAKWKKAKRGQTVAKVGLYGVPAAAVGKAIHTNYENKKQRNAYLAQYYYGDGG